MRVDRLADARRRSNRSRCKRGHHGRRDGDHRRRGKGRRCERCGWCGDDRWWGRHRFRCPDQIRVSRVVGELLFEDSFLRGVERPIALRRIGALRLGVLREALLPKGLRLCPSVAGELRAAEHLIDGSTGVDFRAHRRVTLQSNGRLLNHGSRSPSSDRGERKRIFAGSGRHSKWVRPSTEPPSKRAEPA